MLHTTGYAPKRIYIETSEEVQENGRARCPICGKPITCVLVGGAPNPTRKVFQRPKHNYIDATLYGRPKLYT